MYVTTNNFVLLFPRSWRVKALALYACLVVVCTLQAQIPINPTPTPTPEPVATVEPTPTPTPTATPPPPVCDECMELLTTEVVTLRRFMVILGGAWLGWHACLLLFKYH
jgi:hypothetical protein